MFVFLFFGVLIVTSDAVLRPGGIPNSTYVASKNTYVCPITKEEGSDGSSNKVRILGFNKGAIYTNGVPAITVHKIVCASLKL